MDEKHEDGLVTCLVEHNPCLPSSPKRRRRKPLKLREETMEEIKETHKPKRDVHHQRKRKNAVMNGLYNQVEIISSVMERAQEVQVNLNTKFPSFVKPMIRSNVTAGFWLSLPRLFCDLHLPSCDKRITLVDESREEYYTKYLNDRKGLSAGWRGFSLAHHLQEGDVLVFHLVKACQMKVYIVRANHFGAVEAALSLLHLQTHAKRAKHEHLSQDTQNLPQVNENLLEPQLQETLCINPEKRRLVLRINGPLVNHTQNIHEDVAFVLEGLLQETRNVANAIKFCKLNSSPQNFLVWDKRSTTFECFQLIIRQIRGRLDQLVCLVLERRNQNGCREDMLDGEKMSVFEGKAEELKEATQRLYAEAEVLKIKADICISSRSNLSLAPNNRCLV